MRQDGVEQDRYQPDHDVYRQLALFQEQAIIFARELAQVYQHEKSLDLSLRDKIDELHRAQKQSIIYAKDLNDAYQAERKYSKLLKESYDQLKKSYLDTIFILSVAAEHRDEQTGKHIKRISHYSTAIARAMGCCDEDLETILYASPMHDVGKIGIPDRILFKPDKLTPEEWVVMKQHTTIGAKILVGADADLLKSARIIALTHHERWDGTGYPNGLSRESIPLMSRIVSLADVFDSLTSARHYKAAFSKEKSLEIIREGDGTQFDPQVLEAFMEILPEILDIKQEFRDTD
jgi:putative two-component system response regulator